MKPSISAALVAAFFVSFPNSAQAQQAQQAQQVPACNARNVVLDHLLEKYAEVPVAVGVTSSGALLEVLVAPEGASWTVIVTRPRGLTCLLAAGEGWLRLVRPDAAQTRTGDRAS